MKFSELPYHRPDLETLRKELTAVLERFQAAPDSATAEAAYLKWTGCLQVFDPAGDCQYSPGHRYPGPLL